MQEEGPNVHNQATGRIWRKYCGFLDLSVEEFMEIQKDLLQEQLALVAASQLGRKIMGGKRITSISKFRSTVPITTYEDYQPYLDDKREDVLSVKPWWWAYTSAQSGQGKWAPYTQRAADRQLDTMMSAIILAVASKRGEVKVRRGLRALFNLAPRPYLSGYIALGMVQRFDLQLIPSADVWEDMEFEERIEVGFKTALRTGVDIIGSMSSVLVKIGEECADRSNRVKLASWMLHPQALSRIVKAALLSRVGGRKRLPRDLWSPKGVMCWGTDTSVYKRDITRYWGQEPYEFYGRTETGVIAVQAWNKRAMTFVPFNGFLEFIPEEQWLKFKGNGQSDMATVLLTEVEAGCRYLPVVTTFYGMPFLRYLVGDIIKFVAEKDEETGIKLPQMVFEGRVDDLIDIAGFTRLDEKTVWQAIAGSGVPYEDWMMRKEYKQNGLSLRLYMELKAEREGEDVCSCVHTKLLEADSGYRDLERMLGIRPLEVTLLARGCFKRYYTEKLAAGADMGQIRPPRMNASDAVVKDVLRLSHSGTPGIG